MLYLVASVGSTPTAGVVDAVDETVAANVLGVEGADIYVVAVSGARVFRKTVTPTVDELPPAG